MAHVLKREAAKRDLLAQWVWYAENAGIEIAERFIAAVETTAALLAEHPQSGIPVISSKRDMQTMRRFPVGGGFEQIVVRTRRGSTSSAWSTEEEIWAG